MKGEPVTIYSRDQKVAAVFHSPKGKGRVPGIIACHGLFSNKDGRKYTQIAEELSDQGLAVLRFDFRGCGDSQGKLEETTLTGRMADLEAVLDFIDQKPEIDNRIGVLGSSLGGCVSILVAAEDRRVKAVVTLATPAHLTELFWEKGYYRSEGFRLKRAFLDDIRRYDLVEAMGRLNCPILIVHGEADRQVPIHHAHALYESTGQPKGLRVIPGADHRLTDPRHRSEAIRLSLDWFGKHLVKT